MIKAASLPLAALFDSQCRENRATTLAWYALSDRFVNSNRERQWKTLLSATIERFGERG
jgi:hypothetical protein